ncbi:protein-L-isoaspartate O-methyltransferase family protein [Manganibacter manganicus]|uniref:Protein-L-isoaspartate O-methyltransferase n=1 Tax=Manganibacter manganicus TaxID=1873176 RepID=A0A1V8RUW9_9HYPH|nr:rRNA adenine N-6-methyltransferase family protein [Pseudaminobacter manganicus]OQM76914.1 SAM-dependent methyltransferase [Pseudaminobacter manganicus]
MSTPAEARRAYAKHLAALVGLPDPRIDEAFATVPREAFLGPGPWTLIEDGGFVATPDADPIHIYRNVLVVLEAEKGINNGEPLLHAMWMARIAPQPGETVIHIGAGSGYYTALLSLLVTPGGHVAAYEINAGLAARARANLHSYASVSVIHGDATTAALPRADIVYVNAGVTAPPPGWLEVLKPGGRLIFPWRPAERVGLAVAVTRTAYGYACDPFMPSWFIACIGASATTAANLIPSPEQAARSRSIWLACERPPDDTATAIFPDLWFSDCPIPHS